MCSPPDNGSLGKSISNGRTDEAHAQHSKADPLSRGRFAGTWEQLDLLLPSWVRVSQAVPEWDVALRRLLGWILQAGGAGILNGAMTTIRRDAQSMDQDAVYSEPARPLAQQVGSHVATVLICQNSLVRGGIEHILSGTQFVISAEAERPDLGGARSLLDLP